MILICLTIAALVPAVGTILLVLVAVAVIPYLIHDAKGRR